MTSDPTAAAQADGTFTDAQKQAVSGAAEALQPLGQSAPPVGEPQHLPDANGTTGTVLASPLPFVVASGAGGKFASDATSTTASEGFWHGYTVIRLLPQNDKDGKPVEGAFSTVVEQRPVLDWVGITADAHRVLPGRTLTLHGFGREPVGSDLPIRYDDIDTPAITHRFELLAADPDRPYLPLNYTTGDYKPLPKTVGFFADSKAEQGGVVTAGDGKYERTFAIARLTVGDQVATYPLVFEPRKSFKTRVVPAAVVASVAPAQVVSRPPPAPIVLSQQPASLPPTQPPPSVPPTGNLNFSLPTLGGLPPLSAGPTVAASPPAPAPPPPPAGANAPQALQLTLNPPALTVAPQGSVVPPPAPPIQPAPPGGARKEARQKQAAAAKNDESSGAEGAGESDTGGGGDSSAMTRRTNRRDQPYAFTALSERDQPSAWGRDALYGGGILIMAFLLAAGWSAAGPRSRRRTPDVPAPAWQPTRRR